MHFRKEILLYARRTASLLYPAEILINGLQPLEDWHDPLSGEVKPGLRTKYQRELLDEFNAAKQRWIASQEQADTRIEMLLEAADCVYYAVQIDEQQNTASVLEKTLLNFAGPTTQIQPEEARIAARIKYKRRRAKEQSEHTDAEHADVAAALERFHERQERRKFPGVMSVRNVPGSVIAALEQQAQAQGMSLEAWHRTLLVNTALNLSQEQPEKLRAILHDAVERMQL